MRKRIVILAKYFPPESGGMESYAFGVARALSREFDVHVLAHATDNTSSSEQWDGFRVARCATWFSALSQPISPSQVTQLRRLAPDIVHLNAPNALANLSWALVGRGSRLVVTHHADVLGRALAKQFYTPLYRQVISSAKAVIVFSRKNAKISSDLPPCDNKLAEIPFGVDPDLWRVDDDLKREARAFRETWGGGGPVVSFVGRLINYKGLDVLIAALAQVEGAHAFIAGGGPLFEQLKQAARDAGLSDRFHLFGDVDERTKRVVMLASDVFVLPSVSTAEAFGISQVEAQMMGLPIIATDLPSGVTDVTEHGVTGLLVPPRDATALAAAMKELFYNPALKAHFAAAGYARAHEKFTSVAFAKAHLSLFERVAG